MQHHSTWRNVYEALMFLDTVTDYCARGALQFVHIACLECDEPIPLTLLSQPLHPESELDVLAFYQAVENTFMTPYGSVITEPPPTQACKYCLNAAQAVSLAQSLSDPKQQSILLRFIGFAHAGHDHETSAMDLLFCCRLLAAVISDKERLTRILSGEVGRELDRIARDPDSSINAW
jgi:hypothetical protein